MILRCYDVLCFFFQAEGGIRDYKVTGVQTCALPIYIASAFGNTSKQYLNLIKGKKPISGGGGTYGKPNSSNLTGNGLSRGGNVNEFIGPLGKGLNKSKPVNVTGPNPAHNIGAGGNSYPGAGRKVEQLKAKK